MCPGWVTWGSVESWDGAQAAWRPARLLSRAVALPHTSAAPQASRWGCCSHSLTAAARFPSVVSPEPPHRVLSPFSVSDLPQGAETFRVSGSSGLEVFVVYDPARVTAPTDKTHWPLDANVDVTVSVDTASKDLNDLKVRGCFPTEWGFISHPTPVQGKRPPKCSPIHILPPLNRTPQGLGHLHLHNTSW